MQSHVTCNELEKVRFTGELPGNVQILEFYRENPLFSGFEIFKDDSSHFLPFLVRKHHSGHKIGSRLLPKHRFLCSVKIRSFSSNYWFSSGRSRYHNTVCNIKSLTTMYLTGENRVCPNLKFSGMVPIIFHHFYQVLDKFLSIDRGILREIS